MQKIEHREVRGHVLNRSAHDASLWHGQLALYQHLNRTETARKRLSSRLTVCHSLLWMEGTR